MLQDLHRQPEFLGSSPFYGPHVFIDVSGSNETHDAGDEGDSVKRGQISRSLCNEIEAWVVTSLVQSLVAAKKQKVKGGALTIGCISPYKLQVGHTPTRLCNITEMQELRT
jgi:hypothetical protein